MHRILTPAITATQRQIVDQLPEGGTIPVRLVRNTKAASPNLFTPEKLYIARRSGVGRALRVYDNKGQEKVILLGEPCAHHPIDTALRDAGMVSYWVAEYVEGTH